MEKRTQIGGCYLLIILGEPLCEDHKERILQKVAKGLLSWDTRATGCDLKHMEDVCAKILSTPDASAENEILIQHSTDKLAVEVLLNPQIFTLKQCLRNLLIAPTGHKHLIHAGYSFTGTGSWMLQDGIFKFQDFVEAFQDPDVESFLKGCPPNSVTLHIHCAAVGEWITTNYQNQKFSKLANVQLNPPDSSEGVQGAAALLDFFEAKLKSLNVENEMLTSPIVGNIRFNRPTLYVFPSGQGDCSLFGVTGFTMLIDGGFTPLPCFWKFVRHLERLDSIMVTRLNESNLWGVSSLFRKKVLQPIYPHIGYVFCNITEGKVSPTDEMKKDRNELLVSVIDIGQKFLGNLRNVGLSPHQCLREPCLSPLTLYHKVGHGTLDMFILSPPRDSRILKDFLQHWSLNKESFSFVRTNSATQTGQDIAMPISNVMSICCLLIWKPADPHQNITRMLFPGSAPQSRIFEGLEKIKQLDVLCYPTCSRASLRPPVIEKPKLRPSVESTIKSSTTRYRSVSPLQRRAKSTIRQPLGDSNKADSCESLGSPLHKRQMQQQQQQQQQQVQQHQITRRLKKASKEASSDNKKITEITESKAKLAQKKMVTQKAEKLTSTPAPATQRSPSKKAKPKVDTGVRAIRGKKEVKKVESKQEEIDEEVLRITMSMVDKKSQESRREELDNKEFESLDEEKKDSEKGSRQASPTKAFRESGEESQPDEDIEKMYADEKESEDMRKDDESKDTESLGEEKKDSEKGSAQPSPKKYPLPDHLRDEMEPDSLESYDHDAHTGDISKDSLEQSEDEIPLSEGRASFSATSKLEDVGEMGEYSVQSYQKDTLEPRMVSSVVSNTSEATVTSTEKGDDGLTLTASDTEELTEVESIVEKKVIDMDKLSSSLEQKETEEEELEQTTLITKSEDRTMDSKIAVEAAGLPEEEEEEPSEVPTDEPVSIEKVETISDSKPHEKDDIAQSVEGIEIIQDMEDVKETGEEIATESVIADTKQKTISKPETPEEKHLQIAESSSDKTQPEEIEATEKDVVMEKGILKLEDQTEIHAESTKMESTKAKFDSTEKSDTNETSEEKTSPKTDLQKETEEPDFTRRKSQVEDDQPSSRKTSIIQASEETPVAHKGSDVEEKEALESAALLQESDIEDTSKSPVEDVSEKTGSMKDASDKSSILTETAVERESSAVSHLELKTEQITETEIDAASKLEDVDDLSQSHFQPSTKDTLTPTKASSDISNISEAIVTSTETADEGLTLTDSNTDAESIVDKNEINLDREPSSREQTKTNAAEHKISSAEIMKSDETTTLKDNQEDAENVNDQDEEDYSNIETDETHSIGKVQTIFDSKPDNDDITQSMEQRESNQDVKNVEETSEEIATEIQMETAIKQTVSETGSKIETTEVIPSRKASTVEQEVDDHTSKPESRKQSLLQEEHGHESAESVVSSRKASAQRIDEVSRKSSLTQEPEKDGHDSTVSSRRESAVVEHSISPVENVSERTELVKDAEEVERKESSILEKTVQEEASATSQMETTKSELKADSESIGDEISSPADTKSETTEVVVSRKASVAEQELDDKTSKAESRKESLVQEQHDNESPGSLASSRKASLQQIDSVARKSSVTQESEKDVHDSSVPSRRESGVADFSKSITEDVSEQKRLLKDTGEVEESHVSKTVVLEETSATSQLETTKTEFQDDSKSIGDKPLSHADTKIETTEIITSGKASTVPEEVDDHTIKSESRKQSLLQEERNIESAEILVSARKASVQEPDSVAGKPSVTEEPEKDVHGSTASSRRESGVADHSASPLEAVSEQTEQIKDASFIERKESLVSKTVVQEASTASHLETTTIDTTKTELKDDSESIGDKISSSADTEIETAEVTASRKASTVEQVDDPTSKPESRKQSLHKIEVEEKSPETLSSSRKASVQEAESVARKSSVTQESEKDVHDSSVPSRRESGVAGISKSPVDDVSKQTEVTKDAEKVERKEGLLSKTEAHVQKEVQKEASLTTQLETTETEIKDDSESIGDKFSSSADSKIVTTEVTTLRKASTVVEQVDDHTSKPESRKQSLLQEERNIESAEILVTSRKESVQMTDSVAGKSSVTEEPETVGRGSTASSRRESGVEDQSASPLEAVSEQTEQIENSDEIERRESLVSKTVVQQESSVTLHLDTTTSEMTKTELTADSESISHEISVPKDTKSKTTKVVASTKPSTPEQEIDDHTCKPESRKHSLHKDENDEKSLEVSSRKASVQEAESVARKSSATPEVERVVLESTAADTSKSPVENVSEHTQMMGDDGEIKRKESLVSKTVSQEAASQLETTTLEGTITELIADSESISDKISSSADTEIETTKVITESRKQSLLQKEPDDDSPKGLVSGRKTSVQQSDSMTRKSSVTQESEKDVHVSTVTSRRESGVADLSKSPAEDVSDQSALKKDAGEMEREEDSLSKTEVQKEASATMHLEKSTLGTAKTELKDDSESIGDKISSSADTEIETAEVTASRKASTVEQVDDPTSKPESRKQSLHKIEVDEKSPETLSSSRKASVQEAESVARKSSVTLESEKDQTTVTSRRESGVADTSASHLEAVSEQTEQMKDVSFIERKESLVSKTVVQESSTASHLETTTIDTTKTELKDDSESIKDKSSSSADNQKETTEVITSRKASAVELQVDDTTSKPDSRKHSIHMKDHDDKSPEGFAAEREASLQQTDDVSRKSSITQEPEKDVNESIVTSRRESGVAELSISPLENVSLPAELVKDTGVKERKESLVSKTALQEEASAASQVEATRTELNAASESIGDNISSPADSKIVTAEVMTSRKASDAEDDVLNKSDFRKQSLLQEAHDDKSTETLVSSRKTSVQQADDVCRKSNVMEEPENVVHESAVLYRRESGVSSQSKSPVEDVTGPAELLKDAEELDRKESLGLKTAVQEEASAALHLETTTLETTKTELKANSESISHEISVPEGTKSETREVIASRRASAAEQQLDDKTSEADSRKQSLHKFEIDDKSPESLASSRKASVQEIESVARKSSSTQELERVVHESTAASRRISTIADTSISPVQDVSQPIELMQDAEETEGKESSLSKTPVQGEAFATSQQDTTKAELQANSESIAHKILSEGDTEIESTAVVRREASNFEPEVDDASTKADSRKQSLLQEEPEDESPKSVVSSRKASVQETQSVARKSSVTQESEKDVHDSTVTSRRESGVADHSASPLEAVSEQTEQMKDASFIERKESLVSKTVVQEASTASHLETTTIDTTKTELKDDSESIGDKISSSADTEIETAEVTASRKASTVEQVDDPTSKPESRKQSLHKIEVDEKSPETLSSSRKASVQEAESVARKSSVTLESEKDVHDSTVTSRRESGVADHSASPLEAVSEQTEQMKDASCIERKESLVPQVETTTLATARTELEAASESIGDKISLSPDTEIETTEVIQSRKASTVVEEVDDHTSKPESRKQSLQTIEIDNKSPESLASSRKASVQEIESVARKSSVTLEPEKVESTVTSRRESGVADASASHLDAVSEQTENMEVDGVRERKESLVSKTAVQEEASATSQLETAKPELEGDTKSIGDNISSLADTKSEATEVVSSTKPSTPEQQLDGETSKADSRKHSLYKDENDENSYEGVVSSRKASVQETQSVARKSSVTQESEKDVHVSTVTSRRESTVGDTCISPLEAVTEQTEQMKDAGVKERKESLLSKTVAQEAPATSQLETTIPELKADLERIGDKVSSPSVSNMETTEAITSRKGSTVEQEKDAHTSKPESRKQSLFQEEHENASPESLVSDRKASVAGKSSVTEEPEKDVHGSTASSRRESTIADLSESPMEGVSEQSEHMKDAGVKERKESLVSQTVVQQESSDASKLETPTLEAPKPELIADSESIPHEISSPADTKIETKEVITSRRASTVDQVPDDKINTPDSRKQSLLQEEHDDKSTETSVSGRKVSLKQTDEASRKSSVTEEAENVENESTVTSRRKSGIVEHSKSPVEDVSEQLESTKDGVKERKESLVLKTEASAALHLETTTLDTTNTELKANSESISHEISVPADTKTETPEVIASRKASAADQQLDDKTSKPESRKQSLHTIEIDNKSPESLASSRKASVQEIESVARKSSSTQELERVVHESTAASRRESAVADTSMSPLEDVAEPAEPVKDAGVKERKESLVSKTEVQEDASVTSELETTKTEVKADSESIGSKTSSPADSKIVTVEAITSKKASTVEEVEHHATNKADTRKQSLQKEEHDNASPESLVSDRKASVQETGFVARKSSVTQGPEKDESTATSRREFCVADTSEDLSRQTKMKEASYVEEKETLISKTLMQKESSIISHLEMTTIETTETELKANSESIVDKTSSPADSKRETTDAIAPKKASAAEQEVDDHTCKSESRKHSLYEDENEEKSPESLVSSRKASVQETESVARKSSSTQEVEKVVHESTVASRRESTVADTTSKSPVEDVSEHTQMMKDAGEIERKESLVSKTVMQEAPSATSQLETTTIDTTKTESIVDKITSAADTKFETTEVITSRKASTVEQVDDPTSKPESRKQSLHKIEVDEKPPETLLSSRKASVQEAESVARKSSVTQESEKDVHQSTVTSRRESGVADLSKSSVGDVSKETGQVKDSRDIERKDSLVSEATKTKVEADSQSTAEKVVLSHDAFLGRGDAETREVITCTKSSDAEAKGETVIMKEDSRKLESQEVATDDKRSESLAFGTEFSIQEEIAPVAGHSTTVERSEKDAEEMAAKNAIESSKNILRTRVSESVSDEKIELPEASSQNELGSKSSTSFTEAQTLGLSETLQNDSQPAETIVLRESVSESSTGSCTKSSVIEITSRPTESFDEKTDALEKTTVVSEKVVFEGSSVTSVLESVSQAMTTRNEETSRETPEERQPVALVREFTETVECHHHEVVSEEEAVQTETVRKSTGMSENAIESQKSATGSSNVTQEASSSETSTPSHKAILTTSTVHMGCKGLGDTEETIELLRRSSPSPTSTSTVSQETTSKAQSITETYQRFPAKPEDKDIRLTRDSHIVLADDDQSGLVLHKAEETLTPSTKYDAIKEFRKELETKADPIYNEEDEIVRHPTPPGDEDFYEKVGTAPGSSQLTYFPTAEMPSQHLRRSAQMAEQVLYEEPEDDDSTATGSQMDKPSPSTDEPLFSKLSAAEFPEVVMLSGGTTPSEPHSPLDAKSVSRSGSIRKTGTTVSPIEEDKGPETSAEAETTHVTETVSLATVTSSTTTTTVEVRALDDAPLHGETTTVSASSSSAVGNIRFSATETEEQKEAEIVEMTIKDWGKPLGLPSPPDTVHSSERSSSRTRHPPSKHSKVPNDTPKTVTRQAKTQPPEAQWKPIYLDLAYVPHHGDLHYCNADYFKRIRARYYVFSGTNPSKEVFDALIEGKKSWEEKDSEVTIIPTHETETLGFWMSENHEVLEKYKIDVAPSANRCTVTLQDHETSCAAYRLEF